MGQADILIVAPVASDLEALSALLGRGLSGSCAGLAVVANAVGIGMPSASGRTGARIESLRPRVVVLVGTCAAYPGRGLVPGQVVVGDRIVLADAMVLQGRSSFPDPMAVSLETHRVITSALVGVGMRKVGIGSPISTTTDLAVASAFAMRLSCDVEYSEAFGVGLACAPTQVPFVAVLGVSHEIGPAARESWRVNHRNASHAALGLVMSWIQAGAVGLAHRTTSMSP